MWLFIEWVKFKFDFKKDNGDDILKHLIEQTKQTTVPNVFVNGQHVGGFDDTSKANKDGRLKKLLGHGNDIHLKFSIWIDIRVCNLKTLFFFKTKKN